ncbi:GMC oxidoreductase [Qipengyuania soli]|uniref:GMC family oxidoreductase n=1 Tax=Qipengyuania soli TaxID=2782568 RepID=A0A7S8F4S1_9SPHN|nr:GMC oxidoreductase [Qipengyuania soli]QPC99146.1 GMC family oxidoreductase [Qipengyuania soli]
MKTRRIDLADNGAVIATDLAIVGAGPVGLAIAERCERAGIEVLLLESGLEQQDPAHEALNEIFAAAMDSADARAEFHGPQAKLWDPQRQAYGVRCRGLGGSTQAWAGKSASFDPIDFEPRDWVASSGWPIKLQELAPYIAQAGEMLGLSPDLPVPAVEAAGLRSFYWQFAGSRVDRLDLMRFGRDLAPGIGEGAQCLLDATVTEIGFNEASGEVSDLHVASLTGARITVRPRRVVLAASAIENARLMLASPCGRAGAALNRYDNVGRYLVDHAGTRLGLIGREDAARMSRLFGFQSLAYGGRSHMFQHGLALDPATQRRQRILNGAVWFAQQRAPDDPWPALERLLRRRSAAVGSDFATVLRGSGLVLRGAAVKALASPHMPEAIRRAVIEAAIRILPNAVADEFQTGGLPHKLSGLSLEAIVETAPRRENRIDLSDRLDALGQPLPCATWRTGEEEHRTLRVMASSVAESFAANDWPVPDFEPWIDDVNATPSIIDCAHSMGTTRMASTPSEGVVDTDCRVHGAANLFAAGGSVFPTGGHANPTWMYLAVALRLADHLTSQSACLVNDTRAASARHLEAITG